MIFLFAKYHGAGNDFIVIDDREEKFPIRDQNYIQLLCKRHFGIGADGLLLLQSSEKADIRMRIFNSDGLEAQMCGNGLRCLVDFGYQQKLISSKAVVETASRMTHCQWSREGITVELGPYAWIHPHLTIPPLDLHVVHTGVPHAVAFVESYDHFAVAAPQIRSHPLLGVEGANVNFAILREGKLYTRTFERGVEGETLACGSGAAAVAIAAHQKYQLQNPITIIPLSQEELKIEVYSTSVRIFGKATFVFHGSIMYNDSSTKNLGVMNDEASNDHWYSQRNQG